MYIKDYRAIKENFEHPVHCYDQSNYYLEPNHPDSVIRKAIESLNFANWDPADYPIVTLSPANEELGIPELSGLGLTRIETIAHLIYHGYIFSDMSRKWYQPSHMPRKYVISSVQNNTPLHPCFRTLKHIARNLEAELLLIPVSYKVTGNEDEHFLAGNNRQAYEQWYPTEALPYIHRKNFALAEVQVLPELKVLPTAVDPVSGLEDVTMGKTTIVGHNSLRMKSIPTPMGKRPIYLWTTGTCSQKSYNVSKAGFKAQFVHAFGGLLLTIDEEGDHFIRTLCASDSTGDIIDLTERYTPKGKANVNEVYELRIGDSHVGEIDATYHNGLIEFICEKGMPERIYLEDVFDGSTISHHEAKNPAQKLTMPYTNLENELEDNLDYLLTWEEYTKEVVVIDSNHQQWLDRWLRETDWKLLKQPELGIWLDLAARLVENPRMKAYTYLMTKNNQLERTLFLDEDDDFSPFGVQQAMHGHRGADGSRGNIRGVMRIGQKVNLGHFHQGEIRGSVWKVGKSCKEKQSYTKGLSSHSNMPILTYSDGKRQMLTFYKGKYE